MRTRAAAVSGSAVSPGGLDTVEDRHPDVHEDDVGVVLAGQGDGFGAVRGLAQDLHVGRRLDHNLEAAPYQGLVVGDDDADRHRAPSLAYMLAGAGIGRGKAGRDAETGRVRPGG